ncbi:MAG: hypothetical protein AAGF85_22145 [Bacteroidota bacterium]
MNRQIWILLCILISSCQASKEEKMISPFDNCDDFVYPTSTYTSKGLAFKMSMPADYEIITEDEDLQIIASKPTEQDYYLESFGVNASYNTLNLPLDEIFNSAIEADQLAYENSTDITNFKLLGKGSILVNDYDLKWILQTYKEEGEPDLSLLDFYHASEDIAYKFTFGAYSSNMDSLICKYEKIISTIEFL